MNIVFLSDAELAPGSTVLQLAASVISVGDLTLSIEALPSSMEILSLTNWTWGLRSRMIETDVKVYYLCMMLTL
jgi:hypothetical protein